jgi:hypothetical protein
MTKKLFILAAVLALAMLASWTPMVEAVGYCGPSYCAGKPPSALCGCPPYSDFPGKTAFCGNWNRVGACWAE